MQGGLTSPLSSCSGVKQPLLSGSWLSEGCRALDQCTGHLRRAPGLCWHCQAGGCPSSLRAGVSRGSRGFCPGFWGAEIFTVPAWPHGDRGSACPQSHHSPWQSREHFPLVLSSSHHVVRQSGLLLLLSPRAGGAPKLGLHPSITPVHQVGTGACVPILCWDLSLINLLLSREVVMVPEEGGEMTVLE